MPKLYVICPIMPPSTGQQTMPRPVNRPQNGADQQRDSSAGRPSSALPTSLKRVEKSERYIPDASSIQWDTVLIPVEEVLPDSRRGAVKSESSKPDNSSVQWDADLIPVREESSKPDANSMQWDAVLIPEGRETEETGDSSVQWDAVFTPVSREIVADAAEFDHVTTSAAVVRGEGESEETAGRPLPVPTKVHATPARESEREGRDVADKSWKRCRSHTGVVRQRSCKGRNAFGTVTADIHPVYDHNKPVHAMTYSQLPPGDGVPSVPKRDKTADTDRSRVISPERPSFVLNSLANECVSASSKFERSRERGNGWEASACPYGSACDSSPGIVE